MDQIIQQVQHLINQFSNGNSTVATVASGGLIVWCITNLKNFWHTFLDALQALVSFTITNQYELNRCKSSTDFQDSFNEVLSRSIPLWDRSENLDFENYRSVGEASKTKQSMMYNTSIRLFYGRLIVVHRSIDNQGKHAVMSTTIRVYFTRKAGFVKRLMEDVTDCVKKRQDFFKKSNRIAIQTSEDSPLVYKLKRNLDSIFTNGDVHKELFQDIKNFINNEEIYRKLNCPYSYSALLHGVPGSGKSSTILAIASELNYRVDYINLSKTTLEGLSKRLRPEHDQLPRLFVFEDIDALTTGFSQNRGETGQPKPQQNESSAAIDRLIELGGLSLSDLLNITDGLLTTDGSIFLFTTNHIDRLDPALLRAGRMNKIVEFTYLDSISAYRMANAYIDCSSVTFADGIKPAELQEMLLNILLGRETKENLIKKFGKEN